jgi:hypothetical protein
MQKSSSAKKAMHTKPHEPQAMQHLGQNEQGKPLNCMALEAGHSTKIHHSTAGIELTWFLS